MKKSLRLRGRLLLALAVPVIGGLAAALALVADRWSTLAAMRELPPMIEIATTIGDLVHELQRERGSSALFIGSKGTQFTAELPAQHQRTDATRARLDTTLARIERARLPGPMAKLLQEAEADIAALAERRRAITALGLPGTESFGYYTALIARLLAVDGVMSQTIDHRDLARGLAGYVMFAEAKERAGQERGAAVGQFAAGSFEPATHRRWLGVLAEQETYLRAFLAGADGAERAVYERTVAGPAIQEIAALRKAAAETPPGQKLAGIDPSGWFRISTQRIDMMKQVEDQLAQRLVAAADTVRAAALRDFAVIGAIALAALIVALALALHLLRGITRPLADMTATMGRLAAGDRAVVIPATERQDEVGEMARAVEIFKQGLVENERLQREAEAHRRQEEANERDRELREREAAEERRRLAEQAREAELKREREAEAAKHQAEAARQAEIMARQQRLDAVFGGFEVTAARIVGSVADAAGEMRGLAERMVATADGTKQRAGTVAAAAEQASASVQTVAAAAEELAASVSEISRQVQQSAGATAQAVTEADQANGQVKALTEAAERIGTIVQLITDIASQTNLLALNATIEAARAGDAGKGFAVVAGEVKTLAGQTAKATREIAEQIAGIQASTQGAVGAIRAIAGTVVRTREVATAIASAVEEQGAATGEIARNVNEASAGTRQVSDEIQGVSGDAVETGTMAERLLGSAGDLAAQAEAMRRAIAGFVDEVKAA